MVYYCFVHGRMGRHHPAFAGQGGFFINFSPKPFLLGKRSREAENEANLIIVAGFSGSQVILFLGEDKTKIVDWTCENYPILGDYGVVWSKQGGYGLSLH